MKIGVFKQFPLNVQKIGRINYRLVASCDARKTVDETQVTRGLVEPEIELFSNLLINGHVRCSAVSWKCENFVAKIG